MSRSSTTIALRHRGVQTPYVLFGTAISFRQASARLPDPPGSHRVLARFPLRGQPGFRQVSARACGRGTRVFPLIPLRAYAIAKRDPEVIPQKRRQCERWACSPRLRLRSCRPHAIALMRLRMCPGPGESWPWGHTRHGHAMASARLHTEAMAVGFAFPRFCRHSRALPRATALQMSTRQGGYRCNGHGCCVRPQGVFCLRDPHERSCVRLALH